MKYIVVNDQWKLKVDEYNYQPVRFKMGGEIKTGKYKGRIAEDKWVALDTYYSDLGSALRKIAELSILYGDQEELSLGEYAEALEKIKEGFSKKFNLLWDSEERKENEER